MRCVKCGHVSDVIEFIPMPAKGNAVRCRSGLARCPGFMTARDIERWTSVCWQAAGRKALVALAEWLRSAPVELVKRQADYVRKSRAALEEKEAAAARVEQWRRDRAARGTRKPRRVRTK